MRLVACPSEATPLAHKLVNVFAVLPLFFTFTLTLSLSISFGRYVICVRRCDYADFA